MRPVLFAPAVQGLAAAWAVSTASVAFLVLARGRSGKAFARAFGGGLALRGLVLVALMAKTYGVHWEIQGALLGAYSLGILFLLLLEYKNLA